MKGGPLPCSSPSNKVEPSIGRPALNLCRQFKPSRLLQNDSEQPLLVEPPHIGTKRLGLCDQLLMTRRVLSEGTETPIGIDVIDHYGATWSKMRPRSIQFEAYIAFAMQAVMHEQTKMTELGKYLGKTQSAGAFD